MDGRDPERLVGVGTGAELACCNGVGERSCVCILKADSSALFELGGCIVEEQSVFPVNQAKSIVVFRVETNRHFLSL